MNARVKDVMTTQVVAVRRGATFKEMATTYPDEDPAPVAAPLS